VPRSRYASLPYDPFTPYLQGKVRSASNGTQALPSATRHSIKHRFTYSLMNHISRRWA
jgi:photosynthetic reaction center cytochrome c subunit